MSNDFVMCFGDGCPLRARCVRARARTSGRQDYFVRAPYEAARDACEHFWDVSSLAPKEHEIRERAYMLWVAAGRPVGDADAHWRAARAELEAQVAARLVDATQPL
jgi:hypothetical protein